MSQRSRYKIIFCGWMNIPFVPPTHLISTPCGRKPRESPSSSFAGLFSSSHYNLGPALVGKFIEMHSAVPCCSVTYFSHLFLTRSALASLRCNARVRYSRIRKYCLQLWTIMTGRAAGGWNTNWYRAIPYKCTSCFKYS